MRTTLADARRRRRRTGRDTDERGVVAVEFALILVPFTVLLFGLMQFGTFFFAAQSGAAAAREAARRSAVGDYSCTELTSSTQANARWVVNGFTVTRKYYDTATVPITDTSTTKAVAGVGAGDNVRVVVTYNYPDLHFPLIPVPRSGVIKEAAVARVENTTTNTTVC